MRKANSAVQPLMTRIENMARKEHRNIVGQLTHILEVYEKTTGITGKRAYNRKPKQLVQEKVVKPKRYLAQPRIGTQLSLLDDPVGKPRKVRKDLGGNHKMTAQGRKNIAAAQKLRHARKKLQQTKAAHKRS